MKLRLRNGALAAVIATMLPLAPGAAAQTTAADEQALSEARAELERAARRVAELSRKLGRPGHAPVVIERHVERRPVLGVVLAADEHRGVRIAGVTPDSGAASAGLRSGDRLVAIDGQSIDGGDGAARTEHARRLLATLSVDRPVAVEYERDGRRASARVTPRIGEPAAILPVAAGLRLDGRPGIAGLDDGPAGPHSGPGAPRLRRVVRHGVGGTGMGDTEEIELAPAPGVAPRVHREIIRLGPQGECGGAPCRLPLISDALRWNGLNLASVDAQLGRYFGTEHGVLVLSTRPELGGLQAGDVIRSIDGTPVSSPREVMAALRGRDAGARVEVAYLRDRKPGSTRITVPKTMPLRMPVVPPAPPAPDAPAAPSAPPTPAAPAASGAPHAPAAPDAPPPAPLAGIARLYRV